MASGGLQFNRGALYRLNIGAQILKIRNSYLNSSFILISTFPVTISVNFVFKIILCKFCDIVLSNNAPS